MAAREILIHVDWLSGEGSLFLCFFCGKRENYQDITFSAVTKCQDTFLITAVNRCSIYFGHVRCLFPAWVFFMLMLINVPCHPGLGDNSISRADISDCTTAVSSLPEDKLH